MSNKNRPAHVVLGVFAILFLVVGFMPGNTMGAFTAQLTSENTAGMKGAGSPSNPPIDVTTTTTTCQQAIQQSAAQDGVFAYHVRVPASGSWLTDLSPANNSGIVNMPSLGSLFTNPCRRDEAVAANFTGRSDMSYIATVNQLSGTPADFTEELWIRTTSTEGTLMGFYSSPTPDGGRGTATLKLNIDPVTGGLVFSTLHAADHSSVYSIVPINDGTWHHVVARRSAGTLSIFTDGVPTGTATEKPSPSSFPGYLRVGCDNQIGWPGAETGAQCYAGDMAYAAAYSRALSDQEITSHYYASK